MTQFTPDDLALITECAAMPDREAAWKRLQETFGPRGDLVMSQAAQAADKLTRFGEAVPLGGGEYIMRARETFTPQLGIRRGE